MKMFQRDNGDGRIELSKSEWERLGKKTGWMDRLAMPIPISDEQRQEMAGEGVYVTDDQFTNELPLTKKTKIKEIMNSLKENEASDFFANLDPKEAIVLPAIYKADPSLLVDIDGHNYYIINVEKPKVAGRKQTKNGIEYLKGDNIPGKIIAMDSESGLPVPFIYEQVIDRIKTPTENKERLLASLNKEIEAWNKRVDTIEKAAGATKLALQVAWAEGQVQSRIEELDGQIESITQNQQNNLDVTHPGYTAWMDSVKEAIANGNLNLRDAFHSLVYIHQSNPQALLEGLENGTIQVPEELRAGLIAVAAQELQLKGEKEMVQMQKDVTEEARLEEDLPPGKEPVEEQLRPLTLDEIPDTEFKKLNKYKTLGHWKAQMDRQLGSIGKDKVQLEEVKSALEGLRGYIGSLEKGQRAKSYLSSPEGQPIIDELRNFLNVSQKFIKRYSVDVIEDNTVNPKLLGRGATGGNALLAISLNRIYSIIQRTLSDVTAPVEAAPVEAKTKTKIERMSDILWQSFEDKMRLK